MTYIILDIKETSLPGVIDTQVILLLKSVDRAMANISWSQIYNRVGVENLMARCSHQRPIPAFCDNQAHDKVVKKRLFRYEASWNLEKDCRDRVDHCWNRGGQRCEPLERVL